MPQMAEMTRSHKVTQALLQGFNSGIFQENTYKIENTNKAKQRWLG